MKLIARIGLVLALFLVAASCSVDQLKASYWSQGIDPGQYSEADLQAQAAAVTAYMFEQQELHKFDWVLSDGQLFNLRWCESTDNYQAVERGRHVPRRLPVQPDHVELGRGHASPEVRR